MNKIVIVGFAACVFGLSAFAAVQHRTPEEKEAMRLKLLQRTGGIVEKAGEGKVVYVNCQKKFSIEQIRERVAAFRKMVRVAVEVVEGSLMMYKLPESANAAVYIVDDADLPMSLVAVEKGWGLMNVAELGTDEKRFNREFTRVSVLTFGAGVSQFKGAPMSPVSSPADLDDIKGENITFDSMQSIVKNLKARGVTEVKLSSYRKACQEGWASAPTNEYQKAVWEQVKAEANAKPTNPMKIVKPNK